MDAKEKERQILDAQKAEKADLTQEQEADVFFPESPEVKIKDRVYKIGSLKLRQMKLLLRLARIDLKKIDEGAIDGMVSSFSEILGEPDVEFLEKNLDMGLVHEIMVKVRAQTYAGIPAQSKGAPRGQ